MSEVGHGDEERGRPARRIELTIKHDGRSWIAENDRLTATAETLEQLDERTRELLEEDVPSGEILEVMMRFDVATLPQWMRQYSQHYFNRIIQVRG